jgi:hypothetical protein
VFHVKQLRNISARPQLVVDSRRRDAVYDTVTQSRVGLPGPFGRERLIEALPTNKNAGPLQLVAAEALHDSAVFYLGDPDGNLIGVAPLWVHRCLAASTTVDTRRL